MPLKISSLDTKMYPRLLFTFEKLARRRGINHKKPYDVNSLLTPTVYQPVDFFAVHNEILCLFLRSMLRFRIKQLPYVKNDRFTGKRRICK